MEDVEGVLTAGEFGIDDGCPRAAEAGGEVSSALDCAPGVFGAVGDEDRGCVGVDVRLWLEGRRRTIGFIAEVVSVVAIEEDRARDLVSAASNPGWNVGLFGVRAQRPAMLAPAELPTRTILMVGAVFMAVFADPSDDFLGIDLVIGERHLGP